MDGGSSSSHLVLLGLGLAEGNVPLGGSFVEGSATGMALNHTVFLGLPGLLHNPSLLLRGYVVAVVGLLDTCPQLKGFFLPFGHLLLSLLLLDFLLDYSPLLHKFDLLIGDKSMLLCVKFFSFLLENLLADPFVLLDAIRVEASSAALSARNQLRGVIFNDVDSVIPVDFLDGFIFKVVGGHPVVVIVFVGGFFVLGFGRLSGISNVVSIFEGGLFVLLSHLFFRRLVGGVMLFVGIFVVLLLSWGLVVVVVIGLDVS